MGIQTNTFYDSGARRRRLVYLLSFLVVVGSIVGILLIAGSGNGKKEDRGPKATADAGSSPGNGRSAVGTAGSGPDAPAPSTPGAATTLGPRSTEEGPLAEADRLYREGVALVKESMTAVVGSEEASESRTKALRKLQEAQVAYERWLADHPEDESHLDNRLTDLTRNLYWLRKTMSVAELNAVNGEGHPRPELPPERPEPTLPERPERPTPTNGSSRVEPPHPVEPAFDAKTAAARFESDAARAFRTGDPGSILERGRELLADPRMEGHLTGVRPAVDRAEELARFLDGARRGLATRVNEEVELGLRKGTASGTLLATEPSLVLRTQEGEKTIELFDLGAGELVGRAAEAGALATAADRLAAGRYLLLRGDREEAARQILTARAAGADTSGLDAEIEKEVARSPELKALAAWIALEPALAEPDAALGDRIRAFRREYGGTPLFREHRKALLAAESASAAAAPAYSIDALYHGESKVSSRGSLHLAYGFDDPAELMDWHKEGDWKVENGRLTGTRGKIVLQRLDLKDADLTVVLPDGAPATIGLWSHAARDRRGVNLEVADGPEGLDLTLRHGDREIASETVRAPEGPLEIVIQKRADKYLVRLNRKVVLKEADHTGRQDEELRLVGIVARGGPAVLDSLELQTQLDMEWAKAGGERFGGWIDAWWVTRPFPIDRKNAEAGLLEPCWPESRPFDPADAGEGGDGKPGWYFVNQRTGWLDLNRLMKPNDGVATYAAVRIWSPERRTALLELTADDLGRAWMNGDVVVKVAVRSDPVRVPVHLVEGDNVLLVKVADASGAFWTRARFLTKSGEPMPDVIAW